MTIAFRLLGTPSLQKIYFLNLAPAADLTSAMTMTANLLLHAALTALAAVLANVAKVAMLSAATMMLALRPTYASTKTAMLLHPHAPKPTVPSQTMRLLLLLP